MTEFDMALTDLGAIIKTFDYAMKKKDMYGSVPMPLRTVNEAYNALTFEKELMDVVHGFEVTKSRAFERVDNCERHIKSSCDIDPWAVDVLHNACDVLKIVLSRYHETCSSRYFDAKR